MFTNNIDTIVKQGETTYYPSNCLIMIITSSILTINGLVLILFYNVVIDLVYPMSWWCIKMSFKLGHHGYRKCLLEV